MPNTEQQPARPSWWCGSHSKALSVLTCDWQRVPSLLAQGVGTLVLCELEQAGYIERRMDTFCDEFNTPCGHVFYRLKEAL